MFQKYVFINSLILIRALNYENWELAIIAKNEDFDQTYLNTGSKTQNVEELSLDLIFHNNIKSFSKQNLKKKS